MANYNSNYTGAEVDAAIGKVNDLESGKLDASKQAVASVGGLVTPTVAPSVVEIVGIDSTGAQVRIQVDTNDFEIDGTTSPYTLKKKADTSETWVLNETLNTAESTIIENINLSYNNNNYTSITIESTGTVTIKSSMVYFNNDTATAIYGTLSGWKYNERSLIFETSPTGALLTWLQTNGMKQ